MVPQLTPNAWLRFDAIRRYVRITSPATVLEIGPGQGALAEWLAQQCEYTGIELDAISRAATSARLEAVGSGRVLSGHEEVDAQFDLVCAFEVLEHIEDDVGALRQWREYVKPGGHVVLSVPAHSSRYGSWDAMVGHIRRFDRPVLESDLAAANLRVVEVRSYGGPLGYCLEFGRNAIARRRGVPETTNEERTAASGRQVQPHRRLEFGVVHAVVAPFRALQVPFSTSDLGTGYVVLAQRNL
jgi:SAM-dependent methyltransferase